MADPDIIAISSGRNGLVAAAYAAVAGKTVLVLERNAWFGGGVVTRELTRPGFLHDQHSMSHIFIQGNPMLVNDELGLKSRYGLNYLFPEVPMMSVFEDGRTLKLYRDTEKSAASIAQFSQKDAEAFRKVSAIAQGWLPMIQASLYTPPMPVGAGNAMLDGSYEGRELWRVMQMSSHDHLCELFEGDEVRMHFARVAGRSLVSPDEKATGIGMYVFLGFPREVRFRCGAGRGGEPDGGAHPLYRGSWRRRRGQCPCPRGDVFRWPRDRRRHGRRDAPHCQGRDRRRDPPHLLPGMVPGMAPQAASDALRTQITDAACITVHAALDAPLKFKAQGVDAVMVELMPDSYETLRRAFDDLRYGGFVRTPLIGLGSLSQFDPSRVPEGKAILHAWDYVPYHREDGLELGRHQGRICWPDDRPYRRLRAQHSRCAAGGACGLAGRHGAHLAELHARRSSWHRDDHLSVRRASPHARTWPVPGARRRAPLSGRTVPASGRGRIRGRPRHGAGHARRAWHRS